MYYIYVENNLRRRTDLGLISMMVQESDMLLGGSSVTYSTIIILPNDGSGEEHRENHRDIKPNSRSKFIMMYKTVSIASLVCCIIAAVICIANHRQYTNGSPASLETLLRNPHLSSSSLHFHDGPSSTIKDEPLSTKSPHELGVAHYNDRPRSSRPGQVFGTTAGPKSGGAPLPTNEWYLNLLVGLDDDDTPGGRLNDEYENYASESNRVHTIPYIVDTVGPIVGIRMHYPNVLGYGTVVQSNVVTSHGVTVGTSELDFTRRYVVDESSFGSKLGIRLRWTSSSKSRQKVMTTSIIRGMPYGTMEYGVGVQPVVASETEAVPPLVDGRTRMTCGTIDGKKLIDSTNSSSSITVNSDVELYFPESDHTWLVFFSTPVSVRCYINPKKMMGAISLPPGAESSSTSSSSDNRNAFQLRIDPTPTLNNDGGKDNLIVRIALANNCTTGTNPNFCEKGKAIDTLLFKDVLRNHVDVYPTLPTVKYAFADPTGGLRPDSPNAESAYLFFDWMAKSYKGKSVDRLLMFALPHHIDILRQFDGTDSSNEVLGHCAHSLHGNACLVKGGIWAMEEVLGGLPSFMAPRPPNHRAIPHIAAALSKDITYSLSGSYMQGVGDTYFSGKMLAKLGRIIVIAQELRGLAEVSEHNEPDASQEELLKVVLKCREANLPTEKEMNDAIARLRSSVEIWLNGSAVTPFTYDTAWGGLVSCGCLFNDKGKCDNIFPDCPAYTDPGLDFGNGFYNDHHFHYGYHIYAAAIVAEYDREWGRRNFEQVLLYVRDIANPSAKDKYFPKFRQKDWYLGNSWASGIATIGGRPYLNGRNQESSSEAIAAYEAVSMFGSVMMKAFGNGVSTDESYNKNANVACQIFNIGRFLTATEIRSADRYWHVYSPKRNKVYPDSYTQLAV